MYRNTTVRWRFCLLCCISSTFKETNHLKSSQYCWNFACEMRFLTNTLNRILALDWRGPLEGFVSMYQCLMQMTGLRQFFLVRNKGDLSVELILSCRLEIDFVKVYLHYEKTNVKRMCLWSFPVLNMDNALRVHSHRSKAKVKNIKEKFRFWSVWIDINNII